MSARWFRFYEEVVDDPKVQGLPAEDFRGWVNLLCIASKYEGRLPDIPAIAFILRIDNIAARSLVDRLAIAGLIDTVKGGHIGWAIAPHNWPKRQYKSDTSTERVKRFRQRSRNVTETPRARTDSETDTEKKKTNKKRNVSSASEHERFAEFWAAYPRRPGNPRKPAAQKFAAAVKSGANPDTIIAAARAFAAERAGKDPNYTPHAATWLNQERWGSDNPPQRAARDEFNYLKAQYGEHFASIAGTWAAYDAAIAAAKKH